MARETTDVSKMWRMKHEPQYEKYGTKVQMQAGNREN
jgi:hypothetical protein